MLDSAERALLRSLTDWPTRNNWFGEEEEDPVDYDARGEDS